MKTAGDYLIAAHNIISTLLGQHADKKVKSHDGFDGSVCLLEKENKKLSFAGARSSIILISNDDAGNPSLLKSIAFDVSENAYLRYFGTPSISKLIFKYV